MAIKFLGWALGAIFFCTFIYSAYWCTKTISYQIFYRDMVRSEISEMINNHTRRTHK